MTCLLATSPQWPADRLHEPKTSNEKEKAMSRVITARRADECRAQTCEASTRTISAGERINYGGPSAVTHATCEPMDAPRTSRRRSYGSRYTYERCTHEDYPCCGC